MAHRTGNAVDMFSRAQRSGARPESNPAPTRKLPFNVFTTAPLEGSDRFEAWRESIGVIFDVEPSGAKASPTFNASVQTYNLGDLLVSGVDFSGQRFSRRLARISSDGIDHYLVQLYDVGGFSGATNRSDLNVRSGDVQILDLGQPHNSSARTSSTIAIIIPRDLLNEMLPSRGGLHGLILPGNHGAGGVLADFMKSLYLRLPSVEASEAATVARATAEIVAACFRPTAATADRAREQLEGVILERIRRYIGENLGSAELSPDALCRQFRISRTQLYRMFEPEGGVAKYVQNRRLERAFSELRSPMYRHRRVSEIAFAAGFSSEAHFSRAFRQTFGMRASDVRAQDPMMTRVKDVQLATAIYGGGYEEWIRRLSRRPAIHPAG